jgi:hypothetical protein
MLGNSVGGWGMIYALSELKGGLYADSRMRPWETTYITLTLCLNLLCTGMMQATINVSWSDLSLKG